LTDPLNPQEYDRTTEDDNDVLTLGEAGLRIAEELKLCHHELNTERDARKRQLTTERIGLLEQAAERNRHQHITDENFRRFFGYSV
jgi:hypothetical protein